MEISNSDRLEMYQAITPGDRGKTYQVEPEVLESKNAVLDGIWVIL